MTKGPSDLTGKAPLITGYANAQGFAPVRSACPLGRARALLAGQSAGWFHERAVFKALQELACCLVDGEASAGNREFEDL